MASVVVKPPADPLPPPPDVPLAREEKAEIDARRRADARPLPYTRADGNFAKAPSRHGAAAAGFRLWAPDKKRGQSRKGLGVIRSGVERVHALLNQFGRVARRLDRDDRLYLAWAQFACCLIYMRRGFFP